MNSRLPFLLAGLSALGACASIPDPPPGAAIATAADRHEITVDRSSQQMSIAATTPDGALSEKPRDDLRVFASQYLRYGHGAMILNTPDGAGNEAAAIALSREVRMTLAASGVADDALASSTYNAAGRAEAPILVGFARFEAQAPECAPLWSQDLAHQSNNQPWESFGCATQANLAAMIEDPHDLLAAREQDPRDSNRRATVMQAYRQGRPTGATRSESESASVSDAVQ